MINGVYALSTKAHVINHGNIPAWLLKDEAEEANLEADVLVASGDCFVTLATMLDQLHHSLDNSGQSAQPELEKVISILLYLQRRYQINRKLPNYRQ